MYVYVWSCIQYVNLILEIFSDTFHCLKHVLSLLLLSYHPLCMYIYYASYTYCICICIVDLVTFLRNKYVTVVGSRSKKHKFQTKLDIENFRSILFWSENVDSGVKLDTSNLSNSQSNQNDLTHLIVLLIQFPKIPKSVLSKGPNDCYLEFDKTESQYIENWTSNLS